MALVSCGTLEQDRPPLEQAPACEVRRGEEGGEKGARPHQGWPADRRASAGRPQEGGREPHTHRPLGCAGQAVAYASSWPCWTPGCAGPDAPRRPLQMIERGKKLRKRIELATLMDGSTSTQASAGWWIEAGCIRERKKRTAAWSGAMDSSVGDLLSVPSNLLDRLRLAGERVEGGKREVPAANFFLLWSLFCVWLRMRRCANRDFFSHRQREESSDDAVCSWPQKSRKRARGACASVWCYT
jgi:hypothetical protein